MKSRDGRPWRRLIVLAAVTLLIAASCGADDEDDTSAPPPPPPAETTEAPAAPLPEAPADEMAEDMAEPETETTEAPAPADPSGPQRGGTLTFARFFETQNLDPAGVADNGSIFVRVQIYNTLVEADPDTIPNVGPGIADEWSSSPDGMTWTFHIRDNARFSNGDPVTAEDVQFSLERFADPTSRASAWGSRAWTSSMTRPCR